MGEERRAAPRRRWRLGGSRSFRLLLAAIALTLAEGLAADASTGSPDSKPRALALSTQALYATYDPWSEYLASESVCPGGERTDLPVAQQEATVVCLINFARTRRGLRVLSVASVLSGGSTRKAAAIRRCGVFAHNPCGGDWKSAVRSNGYVGAFGENLYLARGPWAAPRVAVDAWLHSVRHRATLFAPKWREQGLALITLDSFGGKADVSLWVSVLGEGP